MEDAAEVNNTDFPLQDTEWLYSSNRGASRDFSDPFKGKVYHSHLPCTKVGVWVCNYVQELRINFGWTGEATVLYSSATDFGWKRGLRKST